MGVSDVRRAAAFWMEALGYRPRDERVDWDLYPEDADVIVLADPDGNHFCVIDTSHGQPQPKSSTDDDGRP